MGAGISAWLAQLASMAQPAWDMGWLRSSMLMKNISRWPRCCWAALTSACGFQDMRFCLMSYLFPAQVQAQAATNHRGCISAVQRVGCIRARHTSIIARQGGRAGSGGASASSSRPCACFCSDVLMLLPGFEAQARPRDKLACSTESSVPAVLPAGWHADPRLPELGLRAVGPAGAGAPASGVPGAGQGSEEGYRAWRYRHGVAEGEIEIPRGGFQAEVASWAWLG